MLAAVLISAAVGGLGNIREEPSALLETSEGAGLISEVHNNLLSSVYDSLDEPSLKVAEAAAQKWTSALQIQHTAETKAQEMERRLNELTSQYLSTVEMGLLGGLSHDGYLDPTRGGTTDYIKRNQCLSRDWNSGGVVDNCIIKWDGLERLERIKDLYSKVREDGVEGDLVECGVWRGGITVMMRALLKAYDDKTRDVYAVDSFNGVPNAKRQADRTDLPNEAKWAKEEDRQQWGGSVHERSLDPAVDEAEMRVTKNILTVEEQAVRNNFDRFNLLDDKVKFVKGYFNDTLPTIGADYGLKKIAILRVDGDLYESTMDVLKNLYPLVAPGGWIVLDDYPLPQSRQAIHDYLQSQGLSEHILKTDRITPEKHPQYTITGEKLAAGSTINKNAYFQKPH